MTHCCVCIYIYMFANACVDIYIRGIGAIYDGDFYGEFNVEWVRLLFI